MANRKQRNTTPKKDHRPAWIRAFLAAYSETGNVRLAAEAAKVNRSTAYRRKEADPVFAAEYAAAAEDAADRLEAEARRRAHDGVARLKFHDGAPIHVQARGPDGQPLVDKNGQPLLVPYVEHDYSDVLLIFLLKGLRPEKYRDNHRHELSGPAGKPIQNECIVNTTDRIAQLTAAFEGIADRTGESGTPGDGA